ncbi:hypothetical protein L204_105912 [Cryptococcus depauperatus]
MQGLVHYSGDSSPELPMAGPSRLRQEASIATPEPTAISKYQSKSKIASGVAVKKSSPTSTTSRTVKRKQSFSTPKPLPYKANFPKNLTHAAQSDLPRENTSTKESKMSSSLDKARSEGLSDDVILNMVIDKNDIADVDDWGIPPEVNPSKCDPQLTAKVEQFLNLKYHQGEHINTRLLSSPAFANPHIYSKLVEFVSIEERATAFPLSGWLTRRNIESLIPHYGPSALSLQQKRQEETVKASKAPGKRSSIGFAKAKHNDDELEKVRVTNQGNEHERHKERQKEKGQRRDDRDLDRERDRR